MFVNQIVLRKKGLKSEVNAFFRKTNLKISHNKWWNGQNNDTFWHYYDMI